MDALLCRLSNGGTPLNRFLLAAILCLALSCNALAQQNAADAPATKEDVERYLQATRSHDMMKKMIEAMSKPMHQMLHDQFIKDKDKLPADFESRMNKRMDDMMRDMPFDEMMQAMVPVYQKHFTKGDIDALVAFYSSPTGQKMLREMPAIMGEAMQTAMPIMNKYMETMKQRVQQEVAELQKESQKKPGQKPPATPN
jgi:hypothetical protein